MKAASDIINMRVLWIATAFFLFSMSVADASNVLERAIETAQPCQSLHVDNPLHLAIDRLGSVKVQSASFVTQGDIAQPKLLLDLACKTGEEAFWRADVSATLDLSAQIDRLISVAAK